VIIVPIPMSSDNYCYLVIDELDNTGVLIDAADPDAVQVSLSNSEASYDAVWIVECCQQNLMITVGI